MARWQTRLAHRVGSLPRDKSIFFLAFFFGQRLQPAQAGFFVSDFIACSDPSHDAPLSPVIPAQAGIHETRTFYPWIPAFAGMTEEEGVPKERWMSRRYSLRSQ
jgi:hypothetical protein